MAGGYVRRRWTAVALAAVTAPPVVAYVLLPHRSTRYGAWLMTFAIWTWWSVAVARGG